MIFTCKNLLNLLFLTAIALSPVYGNDLVNAARSRVGKTLVYDPSYVGIKYPGGDVPQDRGVCTDVVIRSFRQACNMDLQKLIHEDMKQNFHQYPQKWGLERTDANIDHRRVPNLITYFNRQGWQLDVSTNAADYLPGDILTCTVAGKLPHIMIVSDRKGKNGTPLIIHNIGQGTLEEDRLFEFPLTGHFRFSLSCVNSQSH